MDKNEAIYDYVNQILQLRNHQPYIVYGHSMGATLALSVVNQMEKREDPPEVLVVSGNAGPRADNIPRKKNLSLPKKHLLSDEELKRVLKEFGGIPEEILINEELFNYFSPIIRADFQILEDGLCLESNIVLNTPIRAFMGSAEDNSFRINNWKNYTCSSFTSQILSGNHFFIYDHPHVLIETFLEYYEQTEFKSFP